MKCEFTYEQISDKVKELYGFTPHSCAIALVLRELGYDVKARTDNPKYKLSEKERNAIIDAINHLKNK